jgi:hypothetical protein
MRLFRRGERSGSSGRMPQENWRKPARSWANSDCVEVGQLAGGVVEVRDSKSGRGPVLTFEAGKWNDFLAAVRAGRTAGRSGRRHDDPHSALKTGAAA